ncbi:class F sortase [Sutcliffiella sp. NC1]|uniref:class F sortase n=1 Tax=Sutcliffiella sp. NC1 TaxID=3004096 RepID=UPI0022DD2572|nr:class F sortase [Sutcliffiella sp. NC1]WBL15631.1 class F sortase [Sutcliffiella sp. NC1]
MRKSFFLFVLILLYGNVVSAEVHSFKEAKPVQIVIPAIDVAASIYPSHLNENGVMNITDQTEEVAWFADGVSPGEPGNAVLAGHVDGYVGPAIFYNLKKLQQGDFVSIIDENGHKLVFVVIKKETFPYQDAPLQQVFGPTNKRRLNLVTCTGTWNRKIRTHMERLVVFTEFVYKIEARQ